MTDESFHLGVNYWPRRKAMSWWSDFDPSEVEDEFDLIRDLGLSHVRLFLLWEDFQPQPDRVAPEAVARLERVCDIAAARQLLLNLTFFTGHMSGPSWVPDWMLVPGEPMPAGVRQVVTRGRAVDCGYLNPYSDSIASQAAELQSADDRPAVEGPPRRRDLESGKRAGSFRLAAHRCRRSRVGKANDGPDS